MSLPCVGPGRIGNPNLNVGTDPRSLPALVEVAKTFGMDQNQESSFADIDDHTSIYEMLGVAHEGLSSIYESLPNDLSADSAEPELEHCLITVPGQDGNQIDLHVFRLQHVGTESMPAVIYIHGGGMVINDTLAKPYVRWTKSLALRGMVAILLDFRNAWAPNGIYRPFPAGLNDCIAGFRYVDAHRAELRIGKIILQGESGGANLCLATAIRANREGWVSAIDGVYACAPYISGAYTWSDERKLRELPSLKENEGYFLGNSMLQAMSKFYSPGLNELENSLAWPYHASVKDLKGLPPHYLCMDELDPLRDEGIAYFRKLMAAQVSATAEVNLGTVHGASVIFRKPLESIHEKELRNIAAFAQNL